MKRKINIDLERKGDSWYPVVNVSRVWRYKSQVEGQKKKVPQPVVIEEEEEWKVEKIMNKRKVWGRDKYLVW